MDDVALVRTNIQTEQYVRRKRGITKEGERAAKETEGAGREMGTGRLRQHCLCPCDLAVRCHRSFGMALWPRLSKEKKDDIMRMKMVVTVRKVVIMRNHPPFLSADEKMQVRM